MSEHNPNQLHLIGSLAGYEKGEDVQYVAPSPEPTQEPAPRTLAAEAVLGTLSMLNETEARDTATQEAIPDLFGEQVTQADLYTPSSIVRGEE